LSPEESHHALRVLRLASGARVEVFDGKGATASCEIVDAHDGAALTRVVDVRRAPPPRPELVVYQAAAKGRKVDDVVERLAQLGVAGLVVFVSRRSVVRWDDAKCRSLAARWAHIARAAAKQSRGPFVTRTQAPLTWEELVAVVGREEYPVVLYEGASARLRGALGERERLALVVGPEGGFERAEAEELARAGATLTSLGDRILRTENAALVAASAILWHYGAIG
jgi:16S rRNA (uracil1498-N3)-methyltransferase